MCDLIFCNGTVVEDATSPSGASALAVTGNRISALGSDEAVLALRASHTQVHDLRGATVLPGLIDSHLHQLASALDRPHVPLLSARDLADVVASVGARVAASAPGEWVRARAGWHESVLAEGRLPTRGDLDPVSPHNPVYLPRGVHVATVNSAALAAAGITRDIPDPDGGVIVRDASGEPTGVLLEHAKDLVADLLPPPPSAAEQRRLLAEQMRENNALGITSVTEPGLTAAQFELYEELWRAGELTTRSHLLWRVGNLADVEAAIAAFEARSGDALLRRDGLKFYADGGVEGAFLKDPYELVAGEQEDPEYRGMMFLPPGGFDELVEMYVTAARHGMQVQTHVVGDATFDTVTKALREADSRVSLRALRFVVMHNFLPTREGLAIMRELDLLATVQDHPVLLGYNQARWWGRARAGYAIPVRDILDAGIRTGGGTDGPVVPQNPFWSMWWMTTRRTLRGDVLGPEQAITGAEALELYTSGSAYTQFMENSLGTLAVGKLADLVVVDVDPRSAPPDELFDLRPKTTVVDGRVVGPAR